MKKIRFDKLVSLVIDPQEDKTKVIVNGVSFLLEDSVLKEEVDKLTVSIAKDIESKYEKQEDGQYSPEDIEKIQEEVKQYYVKEEVQLTIGENYINILDVLNKQYL